MWPNKSDKCKITRRFWFEGLSNDNAISVMRKAGGDAGVGQKLDWGAVSFLVTFVCLLDILVEIQLDVQFTV